MKVTFNASAAARKLRELGKAADLQTSEAHGDWHRNLAEGIEQLDDRLHQANLDLIRQGKRIETAEAQRDELLTQLEYLAENVEEPPERDCSCHIAPPCSDCVDYSGLREALENARALIAKIKGVV